MSHKEISEKQAAAWLAAAMAAPLAQTASGCSWPVVLVVGGICLVICRLLGNYPAENCRWLNTLQGLWSCVVLSQVLRWSVYCWPDRNTGCAVPLILLLLGAWAAAEGTRSARVCCVLLWPIVLLFGAVLVSGIPEMDIKRIEPSWDMPNAHLITVMLIPGLHAAGKGKPNGRLLWGMLLLGLLISAVTAGVVSTEVCRRTQAPVYELSRSISLFGAAQRFESLMAAAMTMGYFGTAAYLLSVGGERGEARKPTWLRAVLSALLLLSGLRTDSRLLAAGSILFWVVLPAVVGWKKNFKNRKKGLDK